MLFKKLGMSIVYFLIGMIVNWLASMIGLGGNSGGNGYTVSSLMLIGIVLCAVSSYLRDGKLRKEHKGDESKEKAVFNSTLKNKLGFIMSTSDFKIETVIHIIISVILILIPVLQTAFAWGFSALFSNPTNIVISILGIVIFPICMAVFNIISWLIAYSKCYKRKEF